MPRLNGWTDGEVRSHPRPLPSPFSSSQVLYALLVTHMTNKVGSRAVRHLAQLVTVRGGGGNGLAGDG